MRHHVSFTRRGWRCSCGRYEQQRSSRAVLMQTAEQHTWSAAVVGLPNSLEADPWERAS